MSAWYKTPAMWLHCHPENIWDLASSVLRPDCCLLAVDPFCLDNPSELQRWHGHHCVEVALSKLIGSFPSFFRSPFPFNPLLLFFLFPFSSHLLALAVRARALHILSGRCLTDTPTLPGVPCSNSILQTGQMKLTDSETDPGRGQLVHDYGSAEN